MQQLLLFSVFSLVMLMIFPAYAAVESISLEEPYYTDEQSFSFVGVDDSSEKQPIFVIIRGPGGNFIDMVSDLSSDNDGTFTTIGRVVEKIFSSSGIYNATAFADDQKEKDGISILLQYDGNRIFVKEDFVLSLKAIPDRTITEGEQISFTVALSDSSLDDLVFSLEKNPPSGASIDRDSGKFTWTPTVSQGNANGLQYIFDIVVEKGSQRDNESIILTVRDPEVKQPTQPSDDPKDEPKEPTGELGIASFVDQSKDPQSYVDRYNNEPSYKTWFDDNFSEYDSIQQAVGLNQDKSIAAFVDPNKDPQSYVDRYNNEPSYKTWFDDNFSEYDSIYQAVGLTEEKSIAAFVDPTQDPQYYVDRYNNEPSYKTWFDDNFPEYDSINEAVGLDETEETVIGECGPGTELIDGNCELIDKPSGGGCLIATAAYGSEMAPQVQFLREIRDNKVMSTESGATFMTGFNQFYYSFSPVIADYERENPLFKEAVKLGLTPMISSLSILNHADSENEILGYGISLIILNIGMYIAVPAMVIYKAKKFVKI